MAERSEVISVSDIADDENKLIELVRQKVR
jgi:hypothetical protein